MSSRILTSYISSLDVFIKDPYTVLDNSEDGTVAIIINNAPAFYAVSTQRLDQLMKIEEAYFAHSTNDIEISSQFCEEQTDSSTISPIGKFAMFPGWKPDVDFKRMAALWGIFLSYTVTPEELTAFITYWQAEGKMFHHIQWQQKLARSIQITRSNRIGRHRHDINTTPEIDNQIPIGFRG